jgi:hypothetical protein
MAVSKNIQFQKINDLLFDPLNPRIGRNRSKASMPQCEILKNMAEKDLDGLAISIIENGGIWTQEAILAVQEERYGKNGLVVVEGNRRLAVLKLLNEAIYSKPRNPKWAEFAEVVKKKGDEFLGIFFSLIPVLLAGSRRDIYDFLHFRHVTGIKKWTPAQKMQFSKMLHQDKSCNCQEVAFEFGREIPKIKFVECL